MTDRFAALSSEKKGSFNGNWRDGNGKLSSDKNSYASILHPQNPPSNGSRRLFAFSSLSGNGIEDVF